MVARNYRKVLGDIQNKKYDVIITSTIKLDAPYGSRTSPSMIMADGSDMEGLPNSVDIWWADAAGFAAGMKYLLTTPGLLRGLVL